jgi:hypothetical protein
VDKAVRNSNKIHIVKEDEKSFMKGLIKTYEMLKRIHNSSMEIGMFCSENILSFFQAKLRNNIVEKIDDILNKNIISLIFRNSFILKDISLQE